MYNVGNMFLKVAQKVSHGGDGRFWWHTGLGFPAELARFLFSFGFCAVELVFSCFINMSTH